MTGSNALIAIVVGALLQPNATDASNAVFRPGDWPTQDGQYPRLKVRVIRESKQSIGRGGPPEFTVTTVVRIIGEVSAPAEIDNAGAAQAEADLWRLSGQVEIAVIGSEALGNVIQQIASVDSQLSYNADAETHLAGVQTDIALEWYQGPEAFGGPPADEIEDFTLAAPHYSPAGFAFTYPEGFAP